METIKNILNTFSPITLDEMDSVKLMNRTDTKFIFTTNELPILLKELQNDYRVLDINGNKISRYESLYFDTDDFQLFHQHRCGKLNRYKIRFRKYVESELNYFEVKFKNNKGRTIKDRVKQKEIDGLIKEKAEQLLHSKTPLQVGNLKPLIWINYSRITLVNKNTPERVTIDINLHFKKDEQIKNIENLVIAEVKQDKATKSAFIKLMRKYHIREGSISKYCFGIISIYNKIKHNNFKPKLIHFNKVLYGTLARTA